MDACELIMSELVTNAVQAGANTIKVGIVVHRDLVRLSVVDDAPGWPQLRRLEQPDALGPRGLAIVAGTATTWAVEPLVAGKVVWAESAVPAELTLDLVNCHHAVRRRK
jgi:anti-sigma regulatory factor (Ser/Thr protein kinase)